MPTTVKLFYKGIEGVYKELYGAVLHRGNDLIYTSLFAIKTGTNLENLLCSNVEIRNKYQEGDIIIRRDLESIYVNGFGFVESGATIVEYDINEEPEDLMVE